MFIAGPAKRNVIEGPNEAPFLYIPANNGRIMQLHTASKVPASEEVMYALAFEISAPKYLAMVSLFTKANIAPAMKNAGNRQFKRLNSR